MEKFVVTGNGGLVSLPSSYLDLTYNLAQIQTVNLPNSVYLINKAPSKIRAWKIGDPIVEAQSLQVFDGKTLLTADASGAISQNNHLICDI